MLFIKYFIFSLITVLFSKSGFAEIITPVIDPNLPQISYVSFQSLDPIKPLTVSGQVRVPKHNANEKIPAVIIVHGSGGIDSRGRFYAEALNKSGIATLEIDLWAPRGLLNGTFSRPRSVSATLPDAYGALKFLAAQAAIDPNRIGIMGFSWGGVVSMLTATNPYSDQYDTGGIKFAAHVAQYPVCWVYNRVPGYAFNDFTGSPVLIQTGELDDYDNPNTCSNLLQSQPSTASFISLNVFPKMTHAWDRLEPAISITDGFSHLGLGGTVQITPNPIRALQSRTNAINFFKKWL